MIHKVKIVHAALYLSKKPVPQIISESKAIVLGMTGNKNFPTPAPTLADVTIAINNLEAAEVIALSRAKGAAAHKNSLMRTLELMLHQLIKYAEGVANNDPTNAQAIMTSIPLAIRKQPVQVNNGYRVHPTKSVGELFIMTTRTANATYNFESTTDPANVASWASIYKGTKCKFVKTGLVSGTRYYIRVKVTDKKGESMPGNVLSSLVL
jgi:hypothetical protein